MENDLTTALCGFSTKLRTRTDQSLFIRQRYSGFAINEGCIEGVFTPDLDPFVAHAVNDAHRTTARHDLVRVRAIARMRRDRDRPAFLACVLFIRIIKDRTIGLYPTVPIELSSKHVGPHSLWLHTEGEVTE